MSRKSNPKQFQLLVGDKSMFQVTVERVLKAFSPEDVYVSTGSEYVSFIKDQAPLIPETNIISEPVRRDTLGAVGLANEVILRQFPDAIIAAIWGADHIVRDEIEFNKCLVLASDYAQAHNKLVKIDVHPTFPSEHNGWVEMGDAVDVVGGRAVYKFVRFIEKPNYEKAKELFSNRNNLINTGYLVWPAKLMRALYNQHQPEVAKLLDVIGSTVATPDYENTLKAQYQNIPKISIDYGVFEKLDEQNTVIIPTDLGWTDVGTWQLLYQGLVDNPNMDNLTKGTVELIDTQRSLVYSNVTDKVVSVIGLDGVCVIDTNDGLVVCDIHKTDEIKKLVERLESKDLKKYL